MRYEANPKHKEPWQPGRKGSLCPSALHNEAANLLAGSIRVGDKRYAVADGKPYCAMQHQDDVWHGYPADWEDIPQEVVDAWVEAKLIKKRQARKGRSRGRR